ncbi:hypothetical protein D3C73_781260 [compost metagenome]
MNDSADLPVLQISEQALIIRFLIAYRVAGFLFLPILLTVMDPNHLCASCRKQPDQFAGSSSFVSKQQDSAVRYVSSC